MDIENTSMKSEELKNFKSFEMLHLNIPNKFECQKISFSKPDKTPAYKTEHNIYFGLGELLSVSFH